MATRVILTDFDFQGTARVTGLPAPLVASDAAPKSYVDLLVQSVTADGADQASATQGIRGLNIITGGVGGLRLPAGEPGQMAMIYTDSNCTIYPPTGGTLNNQATNVGMVINSAPTGGSAVVCFYVTANNIRVARSAVPAQANPSPLGVAAIGGAVAYARADHVHQMPTLAQLLADAGNANKIAYLNASGQVSLLALGASGTVLSSQGPTADPAFITVSGGPISTLLLPEQASEPSPPSAGNGLFYARNIAGRTIPKWLGPSGVDYPLQPHIGFNNVSAWRGGATTTATTFASTIGSMPYTGASPTAPTIPALASTSLRNSTFRSTISTGATAGGIAYIRSNHARLWRGNASGLGGFFLLHRFSLSALQAGMRCFVGINDNIGNPTNVDPFTETARGKIGIGINANTGNWRLIHNLNGTTPTTVDLGTSFPVNNTDLLELVLFVKPNDTVVGYRVTNLSTGQQTSGTISTNLPANNVFMGPAVWVTNNATAAAATLDFVGTYVETDY